MKIVQVSNNQQQKFGMLKFALPLGRENAQTVEHIIEVELPFAKRIPVLIWDAGLREYAVESTAKNQSLLRQVLDKLGAQPKFVDKASRLNIVQPDYAIPPRVLSELDTMGPLNWLAKHLDRGA